jgi:hypothetical protein
MEGFILLHRQLTKWEWYQDANTLQLFIHLLLMANHKDGRWQGIVVKRGQHITGIHKLMKALGQTEQQIRTRLKRLKLTKEITIKTTNKYSMITITNYEAYNSKKKTNNNQANTGITNEAQTNNNQITTNNNDNNDNNENKKEYPPKSIEIELSEHLYKSMKSNNPDVLEPNWQTWAQSIDYMIRLDKREPEEIRATITWAQNSDFWRNNIKSTGKLRTQYATLRGQMRTDKADGKAIGLIPYTGQPITADDF